MNIPFPSRPTDPQDATGAPAAPDSHDDASLHPGGPPAGREHGPGYGAGYGYGAAAASLGQDSWHLLEYVRVVYRHRWAAITAFLVVALAATAYTYTRIPVYRSSARLLLLDQRESFGLKNAAAIESSNYLETQYALLRSRWVAKRAMERLGILKASVGEATEQATAASTPASATASLSQEGPSETPEISNFLGGLSVEPVSGGLVDVSYSATDAGVAAERANAIAAAYVHQTVDLRSKASKEASAWLVELLNEQRQKVDAAEKALQRYRDEHGVEPYDPRSTAIVQSLTDLSLAATKARTDRVEKESTYRRLKALQNDPEALESAPAVLADPGVQRTLEEIVPLQRRYAELSRKLLPKHPDLIRATEALQIAQAKLRAQSLRVIDAAYAELQSAQAAEASVTAAFNSQKSTALAANRGGVEVAVLERDLDSNRQIFDSLMRQSRELDISGEIRMNTALILESARVPGAPVFPNTVRNIRNGIGGGLVLGLALAFLIEYLDFRLKSPDDVKAQLGLASLGFVPVVNSKELRGRDPSAETSSASQMFVEAFRTIRTNIVFSVTSEGGQCIVVTSTNPAEGKTVVATNLATALAQAGQRVLVVDGDLRRPRAHEVFGLKQEPGLSNVLVGNCKVSEAVQATRVHGLTLIAAGRIPPNPSELLGSKRFREFMRTLRGHYDWIVIDTPPVMVTSDSAIVAAQSDGVVFVVSAAATSRHTVRAALENLQNVRATVLGAVLNKVDIRRHGYYYSKYYRKDYAKYYGKSRA